MEDNNFAIGIVITAVFFILFLLTLQTIQVLEERVFEIEKKLEIN